MAKGATKETAVWAIRRLRRAGFEALLAGGCVRDLLLGVKPADYDVATNATPRQIRRLFDRVLMVGAQFGVAMVLRGGRMIEVATFRSDLSYTDGRRPDKVVFADARADAERRDFTINGMFLDPLDDGGTVIDYVGGQRDLEARVVRAIGDPEQRFAEDYLRMLRAVRFAARLDFAIDPATAGAIRRRAENIRKISGERIREELEKIFAWPGARRAMELTRQLGLAEPVFGSAVAEEAAWSAAMARLERLGEPLDFALALAAMLAGTAKEYIRRLMRHWGASNQLRDELLWLVGHAGQWAEAAEMTLADLKRLVAQPAWPSLRRLWQAEERRVTGRQSAARRLARRLKTIRPAAVNPAPLIDGADLMRLGLTEGPGLGGILRAVREEQLNERIATREQALDLARRLIEEDAR